MTTAQFTENADVLYLIQDLKEKKIPEKNFSDIVDDAGMQYVDLVMEGGGLLGIALVGYVYILEQMNIRFLQLGGASAGSINALLMAVADKIDQPKTNWILEKLANKDLSEFIDGDEDARDFIKALMNDAKMVKIIWKGWQVIDNLRDDLGLNPGHNFHQWVTSLLKEKGIRTVADLENHLKYVPPGIRHGISNKSYPPNCRLAMVAADVTTETKVVFPEMADLYYKIPEKANPADMVRASMSIPVFFEPFRLTNIPAKQSDWENWYKKVNYRGKIPEEVFFIDGGIMSNFPIDLFHKHDKMPECPTFGVKIGIDRNEPNEIKGFPHLLGAVFDSARSGYDFDFIKRNPDYKHLVAYIQTGHHNWLDFHLSDEAKIDLFVRGATTAARFLQTFDWHNYKDIRKHAIHVFKKSDDADDKKKALPDLSKNVQIKID